MPSLLDADFPPEYRVGSVEFLGRKIHVTPDVLIPRLETEVLVKRARNILHDEKREGIIDIGTGSGIIPVSLRDFTEGTMYATDISEKALVVAEENFRTYFPLGGCHFLLSDLFVNVPPPLFDSSLLITANLPYVKANDWKNMSADTQYEPREALFGGDITGFEIYERFFAEIAGREHSDTVILIEFGFDQRAIAQNIMDKYEFKYSFFSDYAGIERFAEIRIG